MMEIVITALFCALLGLACLGGMTWVVLSGEEIGVERIFLVLVSLVLALLFFGMAAWIARQGVLLKPARKSEEAKGFDVSTSAQSASRVPAEQEKAGKSVS